MGIKQRVNEAKDRLAGKKSQSKPIPTRLEELGLSFMASEETKERIETKKTEWYLHHTKPTVQKV